MNMQMVAVAVITADKVVGIMITTMAIRTVDNVMVIVVAMVTSVTMTMTVTMTAAVDMVVVALMCVIITMITDNRETEVIALDTRTEPMSSALGRMLTTQDIVHLQPISLNPLLRCICELTCCLMLWCYILF